MKTPTYSKNEQNELICNECGFKTLSYFQMTKHLISELLMSTSNETS